MTKKAKIWTIVLAVCLVSYISSLFTDDPAKVKAMEPEVKTEPKMPDKNISGADSYDIRTALEERGFKTEKSGYSGDGLLTTMTNDLAGLKVQVVTYTSDSHSYQNIEELRVTLSSDGSKRAVAGKQVMQFVSTFQYDSARPADAAAWVNANFDIDGATTTIGDATFSLHGKTPYVRILNVVKAKK